MISSADNILTPGDIKTLSPISILALVSFLFHEQICVMIFFEVLKWTLSPIKISSPYISKFQGLLISRFLPTDLNCGLIK